MRSTPFQAGILLLLCASASGCMNPNIRWPRWCNPDLLTERRSLERYDPFPDENVAPDTFTRPPSFVDQRTPERQAAEQRAFEGVVPSGPLGPRIPSTSYRNSQVVRP